MLAAMMCIDGCDTFQAGQNHTQKARTTQIQQVHHVQKAIKTRTATTAAPHDIFGALLGFVVEAAEFPGQEAFKAAKDITGVLKSLFSCGFDFVSFTWRHLFYVLFWCAIAVVLAQYWKDLKKSMWR